jgi:hypothetical protein
MVGLHSQAQAGGAVETMLFTWARDSGTPMIFVFF